MPNIKGAVRAHKKQSKELINMSDHALTIVLPPERVSAGQNPLFGDLSREDVMSGTEVGPVPCLWLDAMSVGASGPYGMETTVTRMAGHYTEATVFAEVWLEDVLVEADKPDGDTWLDRAKVIKKGDFYFQMLGYVRLGLPTSPPYLAVIAMKGGSGYGTG